VSISLSEMMVILVVALLVIKPEQLPEVAMAIGRFIKGVRQFFTKLQNDMGGFMESFEKIKPPDEQPRDPQK
jgi:Sec-independent protein translocase protein TatA